MKIRTDFVTNSSSSSFIFDSTLNLHDLKKRAKIIPDQFYGDKDGWLTSKLHWVIDDEIVPLKEFCRMENLSDILEILGWYEDITEFSLNVVDDEYYHLKEPVLTETEEEQEELVGKRRCYMAAALLLYLEKKWWQIMKQEESNHKETLWEFKREENTYKILKTFTVKQLADWLIKDTESNYNMVAQLSFLGSKNAFSELEKYAEELNASDNWLYTCFKELMPKAEYIYFDIMELNYLIAEAIDRATDSVIVYCCHMG